jgi:ankyrin repeat protein
MGAVQQLVEAATSGDLARVRGLLAADPSLANARDASGTSVLLLALYHGRRDVAQVLLEHGPRLDVFEAAAAGRLERVRELLDADPGLLDAYAPDGFYPLGLACFFGHPEVAELLLARGADVNRASRNAMRVTSLHAAVATNQVRIAKALLARGADVDARQQQGWTPLHGAAAEGKLELVALLLAHAADPNARSDDGKTPLASALERHQAAAAEVLRRHGAVV